jgi:hypothetical protein
MKVTRLNLAACSYVCITSDGISLNVLLDQGRTAKESLLGSALDMRMQSSRILKRADLIEAASKLVGEN